MATPLAEPVPSEFTTRVTEPGATVTDISTRPEVILASMVYGGAGRVPLGIVTSPPAGTTAAT